MKKAFTLIELVATIVILGIVASVVSVLVMNIIRSSKENVNRRNIDEYGRIIETSMAEYQSQYLKYPDSIDQLEIEYVGSVIECETRRINPDKTIYLSECKVNGKKVLDKSTEDGYYHYGKLVLTNEEYVDKLGKNIEVALKDYYEENNKYPINYRLLNLPKLDKDINCVSEIHQDGTVYLTKCSIDGSYILNENEEDGYYHYGKEIPTAVKYLLKKTNPITVTNYTDGDIHEMYTFEHEATEQTPALTDYRYIGSDPNNYVEFNNELWRIIGVFKVEDENGNWEERVKIVRNEKLPERMSYGNGWESGPINTYLNGTYLETINNGATISETNYYLGSINSNGNGVEEYNLERSGNKKWYGKLGLIYISDYIYTFALNVDDICFTNNVNCIIGSSTGAMPRNSWIALFNTGDNWVINSFTHVYINNGVNTYYTGNISNKFSIHPTLYLSSKAKIISGNGSIDNAYKLSM